MTSLDDNRDKPTVRVHFPCVHGLATGQTVAISCFPAREMKGTIKAVNGVDEEIARRIIGASGYGEQDERTGIGVIALFSNPLFSGESYGLALAVADKLARFQPIGSWEAIYATGKIPADGCGQVAVINGFAEKLSILLDHARPNTLFIYPQKNHPTTDFLMDQMQRLQDKGMRCLPVTQLDDLQGRLWSSSSPIASRTSIFIPFLQTIGSLPSGTWRRVGTVCLMTLFCLALVFTLYFSRNQSETLEKSAVENPTTIPQAEQVASAAFPHQEPQQQGIDPKQIPSAPEKQDRPVHASDRTASPSTPGETGTVLESIKVNTGVY